MFPNLWLSPLEAVFCSWADPLRSFFLPISPRLGGALQDLICVPAVEGFFSAMWKHLSSLASSCSFFFFFFVLHVSYFISASGQKIRHFLDSFRRGERMTESNEHCCPSGKKFQLYLIDYNRVYATCVCVCAHTRPAVSYSLQLHGL